MAVVLGEGAYAWVVVDRISRMRVDYFASKEEAERERDDLNSYKGGPFGSFNCIVLPGNSPELENYC